MRNPLFAVLGAFSLTLFGAQAAATPDGCGALSGSAELIFDLYRGRIADGQDDLLRALSDRMRGCEETHYELQVHTETVRTAAFNARQSQAVAEHLRALLAARDVRRDRLIPCGYGESRPVSGEITWESRSRNQRVVVRTVPEGYRCPAVL